MDWHGPGFVVALIMMGWAGWLISTWIRARHGYALEDEWGGRTERADVTEASALRAENAALADRLALLERRTASLETIVTDPAFATSQSIERLRDGRDVATGSAR